jgi:cytochrome P450
MANETGSGVAPRGPVLWLPVFLRAFRRDSLGFLGDCVRRYGDLVAIRLRPGTTMFIVTGPDDVQHVLQKNHRNYWKGDFVRRIAKTFGEGLFSSDGDVWRRQRQLMQPAFHHHQLNGLSAMMADSTHEILAGWTERARREEPVDLAVEMPRLALRIAARALFGTGLDGEEDGLVRDITTVFAHGNHMMNPLALPLWVPTARNQRTRHAVARFDQLVARIVQQRRQSQADGGDLLAMLMGARDAETNQTMDDNRLRDEILTFITAGSETTAMSLAWALHLLATHPDVEARLVAEVEHALGERDPQATDLPALPYTRMVFEESMRLYPPAWAIPRQAYEEDCLSGVTIPANSSVALIPYLTHRDPRWWDEPERFDPERFTPERSAGRPEYAYYPFGGGPRGCIGLRFAMMEGQIALATIARRYRLAPTPGPAPEAMPLFTLRPKNGIRMIPHPRHA